MGPNMNELGSYVLHASLGSEVEAHLVQGPFSSSSCASHASCHQANVQASCGALKAEW